MLHWSKIKVLGIIFPFMVAGVSSYAQNLALHKPYTMSEIPNYSGSAPGNDKTSLTDGIFSTAKTRFWSQKTTVGWVGKTDVRIQIDLGSVQPISRVSMNSAGGTAGAYFPRNIFIFLSNDGRNYQYVGDAAAVPDKEYGAYMVKNFSLNNIDRKARYVEIVAIPEGKLLYFDEIEVFKARRSTKLNKAALFTADSLNSVLSSFRKEEHRTLEWKRTVDSFSDSLATKLNVNKKKLIQDSPGRIKGEVGQQIGKLLNKRFNTPFVVTKINPWDSVGKVFLPDSNNDKIDYSYTVIKNSTRFGSFVVTNSSVSDLKLTVKVNSTNPDVAQINIFEVPFVPSVSGSEVADPLIPAGPVSTVEKGLTKMFMIEVKGKQSGTALARVVLENPAKTINVNVQVFVPEIKIFEVGDSLNGNVWPDFYNPRLKSLRGVVGNDLRAHHINTIDIHPSEIPKLNSLNFQPLKDFLQSVGKFDKILLLQNYKLEEVRNGYKGGNFMSVEWKSYFKQWYSGLLSALKEAGYASSQVYFYPYDEPATSGDIADYANLIRWVRGNVPGINFFSTISVVDAVNEILPLVDIGQTLINLTVPEGVRPKGGQVWSYAALSPAITLSPYGFYRLMAWRAFKEDYKGIGFWMYSVSNRAHLDDPLMNPDVDYSVVYINEAGNSIISSRRWEAFKSGFGDYKVISAYSAKFGKQKAKELVNVVLSNTDNLNMADLVINRMLTELSALTQN